MITTLVADWWEGVSELGQPIPEPTWEDCARAIAVMDQQRRTAVILSSDSAGDLSVAGGAGRYFIELTTPQEAFLSVAFSADQGTESLVTGGQLGEFATRWLTDEATAVEIARHFFEHEEAHPGYQWMSNEE
jgi:hypothetical protein